MLDFPLISMVQRASLVPAFPDKPLDARSSDTRPSNRLIQSDIERIHHIPHSARSGDDHWQVYVINQPKKTHRGGTTDAPDSRSNTPSSATQHFCPSS